ncbi:MAG TPA: 2-succinyl-5-enolpyruvyl-6-hydroxy-3-cyclohexene-1-carboxylic-acid synthase [Acidimicrobiia bacterium]
MSQPNPSTALARAVADEMARQGVSLAVISPGSRSAALAIAFDQHPKITTRVVLDERSAAFWALGHARATGLPTVVVATSGTAVANHFPAVVEADESMVPLIVISADRPPEMLHVGANQTIDQVGLFGDRVRWFCNLGPAMSGSDDNWYWRSAVSQAAARSMGHGSRPGPVHLNIAFREPTVPVEEDGRSPVDVYPYDIDGKPGGAPWQEHRIARPGAAAVAARPDTRGLIVAGEGDYEPSPLLAIAQRIGWPILATAMSGLRGPEVVTTYHHLLVSGTPASLRPEMVVTVGRTGPSDRLTALTASGIPQISIDRWGAWHDPKRQATSMLQADPVATLERLASTVTPDSNWSAGWISADQTMRAVLDEAIGVGEQPTGPSVARALSDVGWEMLVAASSMPIRDVDAHTVRGGAIQANRGASGIDGLVSTGLGVAHVGLLTVILSGDLSFLHDGNGFVSDQLPNAVFVVLDNGGGGLFDLLPQATHAPGFDRLFVSPHHRNLVDLATAQGLMAGTVSSVGELVSELGQRLEAGGCHVLLVPVDREADLKRRQTLDDAARSAVSGIS